MREYVLYNNTAPTDWLESIPVGNGRMGVSLMCGKTGETLYLNEETVWSSKEGGQPNPEMPEMLRKVRKLFLEGKPAEAHNMVQTGMSGCFSRICSYESAGRLQISLHENEQCANYKSKLDMMRGISTVEYDYNGSHYVRECFASYPDDVIVWHVSSSHAPLNAWISYDREYTESVKSSGGELCAVAHTVRGGHRFCVKAKVITDGNITERNGALHVADTKEMTVLITMSTAFKNGDAFVEKAAFPPIIGYEPLRRRHVEDFSALMERAELTLPEVDELSGASIEYMRAARLINKFPDYQLITLQWQFGRYLTVSSSRPGSLPSNLQGLWSKDNMPPWSGDYHFNINLQCNYWPVEVTNLSECHLPLFDYMNNFLLESGKNTAKVAYGTRGCVVHHLSDIYGFTTPADGPWGMWPHGASWLCFHMWEHYLFTKDADYLKNTAYTFIKEAAIFFLDNLMEDKEGVLQYAPSTSPENMYYANDEKGNKVVCRASMSSTMDIGIIGGLFRIFLNASEILGIKDADVDAIREARAKLPPFKVGKHGQLQEWIEDFEEVDPGHRHLSPLFAFFPDNAITRETPELFNAVATTVSRRMSMAKGGMSAAAVGWTCAWLIAIYARLRMPEQALRRITDYSQKISTKNLFDLWDYPGFEKVFQIDSLFAFTAAVTEMLLQSHEGVIALLPALPAEWDHGSYKGLRARGGYTVDVRWEKNALVSFRIQADRPGTVTVEVPADARFTDENGNTYETENKRITLTIEQEITLTVE